MQIVVISLCNLWLFHCATCGFLLPQHAQAASGDEQSTDDDLDVHGFFQEEKGEDDGDDHAELVDRGYSGDIAGLHRLEIEEPRHAGGYAGENEKAPGVTADVLDFVHPTTEQYDAPG